jgi:type I restriction enzyme S subunit
MELKAGYKQTEVGIIPEDWEITQLKNIIFKIIDNRGKTPPYSDNENIELIESASVSFVNQYPDYSKVNKFVSESVYKNWFRGHPIKEDILISTVGEYSGSTAIMKESRGTIAQNLIALRIKEVDANYIFYVTKSNSFIKQLDQVMMGHAQPSLRVPWLLNFRLIIPKTKTEQTAIATALSDTDALINALDKLIAKKRLIKQGAMQELLTGKKRLVGFSGKWGQEKIKNLALITTGTKNTQDKIDDGKYPFFVRSQTIEGINSYSFEGEAVLTAGDGVGTGKIFHYINGKFDFHQRVYKISDFSEQLNGYYFYLYFSNNFYNRIMQMTAKSSVDSVRMEMIADMLISLPPTKEEQTAIAQILSNMDNEIEALEKRRAKTQQIKQGMMQELLTGKTRLISIQSQVSLHDSQ